MMQENQNQNLSPLGDLNPKSSNPPSPEDPVSQNSSLPTEQGFPPPSQPPQQTFAHRTETIAETQYASFWRRLAASFLDGIILGATLGIIGLLFSFIQVLISPPSFSSSPYNFHSEVYNQLSPTKITFSILTYLINMIISIFYYIYFIGAKGQTLGKMALNIKVVNEETNEAPGYLSAFLREFIGKFFSLFFFLGFLWVIWDKKKQGWHDKIAHTIVVKL